MAAILTKKFCAAVIIQECSSVAVKEFLPLIAEKTIPFVYNNLSIRKILC